MRPTIYLAGPEVFLTDTKDVAESKKALCQRYGFTGLYPADGIIETAGRTSEQIATNISDANEDLMRRADAAIFNLTPFRGPSADPGTVFEVGFCAALNKPMCAYAYTKKDYAERVKEHTNCAQYRGVWRDENGLEVEDFGLLENLMIDRALARSVGAFMLSPRALGNLVGFEMCLEALSKSMGTQIT